MVFFGRNKELNLLDILYEREGAQLLILHGRRGVGKTAIIEHWTQNRLIAHDYLYWQATQTSITNQLRGFSQSILRFIQPDAPVAPDFSYDSWETALAQVAQFASARRFVLILDEITWAMQANPELPGLLQRAWDQSLKGANLFLILTGSLTSVIQRSALDIQSPLYGPATAQLKLPALSFGTLSGRLPAMTTEQRLAVLAITGGIPAYLQFFDDTRNVLQNLRDQALAPNHIMLNDALFLLREQLDEPRNYIALLEAMASGGQKLTDIARLAGLERSNANKYLIVLRDLDIIERIVPATVRQPEHSRRGRYVFNDAYLRFYFRFLRPNMGDLERGRINQVIITLENQLPDFVGRHTFKEVCREWVNEKVDHGELTYFLDRVGRHWSKEAQIDVVGINWRTKQILFGACHWGRQPVDTADVNRLVSRSAFALPDGDGWQKDFVFFSRTPLTGGAQQRVNDLGAQALSLEALEADMVAWQG